MVAEVSSLSRMVDAYKEEGEGKTELVTLDLLGGCGDGDAAAAAVAADEVNLEIQIRAPGDMRLAASSTMLSHQPTKPSPASPHLHDLNLSPPWLSASSSTRMPPPAATAAAYHSVCTLEKVKSALERESRLATDGRAPVVFPVGSASPPSPSRSSSSSAPATTVTTSSSSAKRRLNEPDETDGEQAMAVAACPECLLYVLICKVEPRCPRCAARVPFNGTNKKPRIDLNFSFQTGSHE